MLLYLCVIS